VSTHDQVLISQAQQLVKLTANDRTIAENQHEGYLYQSPKVQR
jgi:hypothetical protein